MSTFTELKASGAELPPPAASGSSMIDAGVSAGSTAAAAAGALSRVAGLVPSVDTLKDRVGDVWTRSRPWSEFANTSQMNKPQVSELLERVKENAEYYAFNYLVVLLLMSALTIITSPLAFLGGLFIVAAYFYLYFLNPEPIVALGITLDNNVKAAAIMLFSLVVLWLTGAGATFTGLLVVVAVIALTHAAVRKPPTEADFDTAYTGTPYTPATV
jgi:PRA1 family protein 1